MKITLLSLFLTLTGVVNSSAYALDHELTVWINEHTIGCKSTTHMVPQECPHCPIGTPTIEVPVTIASIRLLLPALESLTELSHGIEINQFHIWCRNVEEIEQAAGLNGGKVNAILSVESKTLTATAIEETAIVTFETGWVLRSTKRGIPRN